MASTATSGTDGCGAAFAARKLSTQHNITVEVSKGTYSSNVARLVEHAAPAKLLVVMKSNACVTSLLLWVIPPVLATVATPPASRYKLSVTFPRNLGRDTV